MTDSDARQEAILAELRAIRMLLETLVPALVRAREPLAVAIGPDDKIYRVTGPGRWAEIPNQGKIG